MKVKERKKKRKRDKSKSKPSERRRERPGPTNQFVDQLGHRWKVTIDGLVMKRLKSECNFNVCNLIDMESEDSFVSVLKDIERTVDVLWVCVEEQAIDAGIDEYEFAKGLFGDTLDAAVACIEQALVNFYPRQDQREMLARMFQTARIAADRFLEIQTKKATLMFDEVDKKLQTLPLSSFMNSQESSESIPTDERTEK